MQDMKNYFDKKFNKQAKQTEEMKSGFESALNKETKQYRERVFALEKRLGERNKILHVLFKQHLLTFTTVISISNSNYKIDITITTKEKLNVKLENQLKLIRSE